MFADDIVIMGMKSSSNVIAIKSILLMFELMSDFNFHKSLLEETNVFEPCLAEEAYLLYCKVNHTPFKYLRMSTGDNSRRLTFWKPTIDSICIRLSGWRNHNLSMGVQLFSLTFFCLCCQCTSFLSSKLRQVLFLKLNIFLIFFIE